MKYNNNMKPSELLREAAKNPRSYLCNTVKYIDKYSLHRESKKKVLKAISEYIGSYPTFNVYLNRKTKGACSIYVDERSIKQNEFVIFLRGKLAIHLAEQFEAKGQ